MDNWSNECDYNNSNNVNNAAFIGNNAGFEHYPRVEYAGPPASLNYPKPPPQSYFAGATGGSGGEEVFYDYNHAGYAAPCEGGPGPWNFNYCYGYFGEPPCPYANIIDMEDFM